MTASMLGTLPHIEPSNDLHLPLRQDWHTLATRLKEMYAHSSENKNPFAECAGLTMAIASLNASTKKRKIDLRDVIINNLILSWNIRNYPMLLFFIKLAYEQLHSDQAVVNTLPELYKLHKTVYTTKHYLTDYCLDLHTIHNYPQKTQQMLLKCSIYFCRFLVEAQSSNVQQIHHYYLRQAKAVKLNVSYALLSYFNRLICKGEVPELDINRIFIDFLQQYCDIPKVNAEYVNSFTIGCKLYAQLLKTCKNYIQGTLSTVMYTLYNSFENIDAKDTQNILKFITSQLFQLELVSQASSISLKQLSEYSLSPNSSIPMKMCYMCELSKHIAEINDKTTYQYLKMVYDSIASTLPYLKDNDSYTNFIKSNIINQLQVVKSKHITSLYNTPHKTVKYLPIITKWKYIALSQNYLILKRYHLLATKYYFLAYMPYNVQIIVITTWASERSNLGVFKDTIKIMAERLELSETYSLHTWALYFYILYRLVFMFGDQLVCHSYLAYYCLNTFFKCPKVTRNCYYSKTMMSFLRQMLQQAYNLDMSAVHRIYFNKSVVSLFQNIINPLLKVQYYVRSEFVDNFYEFISTSLLIYGLHCDYKTMVTEYKYSIYKIIETVVNRPEEMFERIVWSIEKYLKKSTYKIIECQVAIRRRVGNLLELYNDIYQLKKDCTVNDLLYFIDWIFHVRIMLRNIFMSHTQTLSTLNTCVELEEHLVAIYYNILGTRADTYLFKTTESVLNHNISYNIELILSLWVKNIYFSIHNSKTAFSLLYNLVPQCPQPTVSIYKPNEYSAPVELAFEYYFESACTIIKKIKEINWKFMSLLESFTNDSYENNELDIRGVLFGIYLLDVNLRNDEKVGNLLMFCENLLSICQISGMQKLLRKVLSLKLSIMNRLSIDSKIICFYIAKIIFLKYVDETTAFVWKQSLTTVLYIYYYSLNYSNDDPVSILIKLLLNLYFTPSYLLYNRLCKLIMCINSGTYCYGSRYRILFSYLAQYIWITQSNLNEYSFLKNKTIMIPSGKYITKHYISNNERLIEWLSMLEVYPIAQRVMAMLLNRQLVQNYKTNQLSNCKSLLALSSAYLMRSGQIGEIEVCIQLLFKKKKQLNVLKIVDCLRMIQDSFDDKSFKRIESVLNFKRKSLSVNFNLKNIAEALGKSVEHGGTFASLLVSVVMYHIAEQFYCKGYEIDYAKSLIMYHYLKIKTIYPWINFKYIRTSLTSVSQIFKNIDDLIEKLTELVYVDYPLAMVAHSVLGYLVNKLLGKSEELTEYQNDQLNYQILKISLIFEYQNYEWKIFTKTLSNIQLNYKFSYIQQTNNYLQTKISYFLSYAKTSLLSKLSFLKNDLKYPLSIIYPLGNYVFNIAVKVYLLITFVEKNVFEDYYTTFDTLIANNHIVIKDRTMSVADWWKSRERVNRYMGRIITLVNIGILDSCYSPEYYENDYLIKELLEISPKLSKLLFAEPQYSKYHLYTICKRYHLETHSDSLHTKLKILAQLHDIQTEYQQNLLLYIHHRYLSVPFESHPYVQKYTGCYRVPSIRYLMVNQAKPNVFNVRKSTYLVNSCNDLPDTEKVFRRIQERWQWEGLVGKKPDIAHLQQLVSKDIFLYMGHGTGTGHLSYRYLSNIRVECVMLIFGCSSARMIYDHSYPHGVAYNYLQNDSPCVMGCLWDVTDKDVDRLTESLFTEMKENYMINLSKWLYSRKSKCKLKYLNGSSLVVFGVPTYLYFG